MAGFHWKQGKQFLLTKLINYAKLLEQQTQQSSHVERKGQKSGGDCISVMHVYPKAHDETIPYPPSQYESFVFRNTVDMRNVLYISRHWRGLFITSKSHRIMKHQRAWSVHAFTTKERWTNESHTASDRSPRTWENYKLNSFARYGSCMHDLWEPTSPKWDEKEPYQPATPG